MAGWSKFYSQMRSSLEGCFRPAASSLSSKARDTIYYADLRGFDRREMSKYGTKEYEDHVTHYTPCMRSNPENNVSILTINYPPFNQNLAVILTEEIKGHPLYIYILFIDILF
jgi:hypothetical protein